MRRVRDVVAEWRPSAITRGAPAFPLAVLFGLNAVDELDRTAFAVLLPDIRDHFGLSDAAALAFVGATAITIVLIELPIAFYADRANRVRIATTGAALWALFSLATGLAISIVMLAVARLGAGGGKAVVTPTHSSLLADYYEPAARVKVFSAHRLASSVGQIVGPCSPARLPGFSDGARLSCCSPSRRSCSFCSPPSCASRSAEGMNAAPPAPTQQLGPSRRWPKAHG
jgi:MFS family permease